MKYEIPEATKQALHYLIQTAATDGVVVAGFAFKAEPTPCIVSFGNCPDKADIKLYEFLCKLSEDKVKAGLVVVDNVQKPSLGDNMKYPETLYVVDENMSYPFHELSNLVGKETLESAVPDNNKENVVAVYQLVKIEKYKKTVTKTSTIEKV